MKLSKDELSVLRDYFQNKPVLKAFLFGSFSRDDAYEDSDIDIMVELDYSKHIGLGFVNMKLKLEDKLQKKIDLISSNALSKHIEPFIHRDKILEYER